MDESTRDEQRQALRKRCRRTIAHGRETPAEVLARTAAWCAEHEVEFDHYGSGELVERFERKVAELLGFEAARFMPTGKAAQNVAMKVWCERAGCDHFGMHPTSHLELHEARAYEHLFGLRATLVGPGARPLLAEHLEAVPEQLAALLVELPIREAGGLLPTWDELTALAAAARLRGTRLHLDGARLWETRAFYGREYAEICAGFDSAYVSFYKGIGALSGAMLLGDEAFVAEARVWQQRTGAEVYTLAPNVASAAMLFDERLARMPVYYERAVALAGALAELPRVRTLPRVPHTNLFHVFFDAPAEAVLEARVGLAEETGVWLLDGVDDADVPGWSRFEWYIGEAALEYEVDELAGYFARLMASLDG